MESAAIATPPPLYHVTMQNNIVYMYEYYVGHCDLHFMLHWFHLIFQRLFDQFQSNVVYWCRITVSTSTNFTYVTMTYFVYSSGYVFKIWKFYYCPGEGSQARWASSFSNAAYAGASLCLDTFLVGTIFWPWPFVQTSHSGLPYLS